jgi:predicted MFS family arabinose efflux permease
MACAAVGGDQRVLEDFALRVAAADARQFCDCRREEPRRAWALCTIAFALGQAVGAYGFSYIFATTGGGYRLLFALAAAAVGAALAIDLLAGFTRPRRAVS